MINPLYKVNRPSYMIVRSRGINLNIFATSSYSKIYRLVIIE